MKYITLFPVLLAWLLVSCDNKPALPSPEEAKTAILEKVNMAAERWANGDPMGYVEVSAPDITYLDDIAAFEVLIGKEQVAAYMKNLAGQVPKHTPRLSAFNFQFYGELVILTYRYQGVFGDQVADPWKVTSVYRYMDGDWFSVHENWSLVKPTEEAETGDAQL